MAAGQTPTYHIAPNFSISPAPAGPIELGSIIASLETADDVLNADCRLPIPPNLLFCHHKKGFHATRSRLLRGELGLWAEYLGAAGIGAEASLSGEKSAEDVYRLRREDTIYFSPPTTYLRDSMAQEDVFEWVEGHDWAPVFIVTGLKIARGPAVLLKKGTSWTAAAKIGADVPLANIGPKAEIESVRADEEGWDESDDFVIGIRVKKLVFKKRWLSKNNDRKLEAVDHNKNARFVNSGIMAESEAWKEVDHDILELDLDEDDLIGKEERTAVDSWGTDAEVVWLVPKLAETGA